VENQKIAQLSESLKAIYIYFNNAAEAFVVRNAISLHRYLEAYNILNFSF